MGDVVDGKSFIGQDTTGHRLTEVKGVLGNRIKVQPDNYAIDKKHPNIIYALESAYFNTSTKSVVWEHKNKEQKLILSPEKTYTHIQQVINSPL
jgi:hypothetical protein